jgi:hypothetical protein
LISADRAGLSPSPARILQKRNRKSKDKDIELEEVVLEASGRFEIQ